MFEFLSLLLNVCFDALYWIILTGIAYEEKRKIYILLNQHQIKIQTNSWKWKWNTENVKSFLKLKMKDFFTYDMTTGHVFKSNNLISVYNLWVLHSKLNCYLPINSFLKIETYWKTVKRFGSSLERSSSPSLKNNIEEVPFY